MAQLVMWSTLRYTPWKTDWCSRPKDPWRLAWVSKHVDVHCSLALEYIRGWMLIFILVSSSHSVSDYNGLCLLLTRLTHPAYARAAIKAREHNWAGPMVRQPLWRRGIWNSWPEEFHAQIHTESVKRWSARTGCKWKVWNNFSTRLLQAFHSLQNEETTTGDRRVDNK